MSERRIFFDRVRRQRLREARRQDGIAPGVARQPQRFSSVLRNLAEGPAESVSIERLVHDFGNRAFGALMFLFAIPNCIPLPPGSSAVLGAPLILIAMQLAVGRRTLWLPAAVMQRTISRDILRRLSERIRTPLRWLERLLSPRLPFLFGPVGDRAIGVVCLILAIILFLPIPLGNMPPAISISLFALALMERDGLVALLGYAVAIVSIAIVAAISQALLIAAKVFFHVLGRTFGF